MTSQLVLINQLAIAVASDTLTSTRGDEGVKTWPSQSKIYELPNPALGVVLHCGKVFLQGTSWRLLVRDFALGTHPLNAPKMADYREGFVEWVNRNASGLALEDSRGVTLRLGAYEQYGGHIGWLAAELGRINRLELAVDAAGSDEDVAKAIVEITQNRYSAVDFPDISEADAAKLIEDSGVDIVANFRLACDLSPESLVGPETKKALRIFCSAALRCSPDWEDAQLNLTFVGFGEQEFLGQVAQLGIYGFWGGALRFGTKDGGSAVPDNYPLIIPIAQSSAIDAFSTGTSGDVDHNIYVSATRAISAIPNVSEEDARNAVNQIMQDISNYGQSQFREPMSEAIRGLGISNLGKFADFLVHLQAFRSATDNGEATVGGRIESLVITPERGVRWRHRLSEELHTIEDSSHVFE